jgi:hypothetical protein
MGVLALLLIVVVVAIRYGGSARVQLFFQQGVRWGLIVGGVGFALGFFGPMILAPQANQGPMLGIFITGPLGFLVGTLYGVFRAWRGSTAL